MAKIVKKTTFAAVVACLLLAIAISAWQVTKILLSYRQEATLKNEMMQFKPALQTQNTVVFNQKIADAKKVNQDIVGWLSVPGTAIEYAFVASKDNQDYLRKNLHHEYALAGTIFMDYRNNANFTDEKIILYGHNMKNSSMFGDLEKYKKAGFLQTSEEGSIILENAHYTFTVFACLEAEPSDAVVYGLPQKNTGALENTLKTIKANATQYRTLTWQPQDRLLLLSTCADDYGAERLIVAARLTSNPE